MSAVVEEEIKRWTARHTSALVLEIILGKTTVAGASRQLDSHCPADAQQWPEMGVHYPTLPAARRDGEMARWIIRTLKEQCAHWHSFET